MLALLSVWFGLICLIIALTMVFYRPAFNDVVLVIELYFCGPLTFTFAGIVLWISRGERKKRFSAARLQCKVACALALAGCGIVYLLVAMAQRVPAP